MCLNDEERHENQRKDEQKNERQQKRKATMRKESEREAKGKKENKPVKTPHGSLSDSRNLKPVVR